jgi:hypothetical protein
MIQGAKKQASESTFFMTDNKALPGIALENSIIYTMYMRSSAMPNISYTKIYTICLNKN